MEESTQVISGFSEQEARPLIDRVKRAPSRGWIDSYFDLMACLIEGVGAANGDPRFVTSIPSTTYSVPMFLPVTINGRYALAPDVGYARFDYHTVVDGDFLAGTKDDYLIAVVYGPEFDSLPTEFRKAEVAYYGCFSPLVYETGPAPFWVRVKHPEHLLASGALHDGWIGAALDQLQRASGSSNQRSHHPMVYEAAVNRRFRDEILDRAFPRT